ncbi:MAG: DUF5017 domain-containing protein [Pedobacter sp.]|nr:MAG: DUF5017 domain-containing protein [Pedobacter sp.]
MKTKYLTGKLVVLMALFMIGCKKNSVEIPTVDINVEKTKFKVGEPVAFNLKGNPDFISFYSGELGNDYDFIKGRIVEIKALSLFFQSRVSGGNQANQFSVHISSDFNGTYDIASVRAATWKDITNLFVLATGEYLNSGEVDLSPLITDKTKPLYLGFRYVAKPQTANGVARSWTLNALVVKSQTDLGIESIMTQKDGGWVLVEDGEIVDPGRTTISASSGAIVYRGNNGPQTKDVYTETWGIGKPLDLNTVDVGPDKSILVKSISETIAPVFTHTYKGPGIYKATFEIKNNRIDGEKTIVKEIEITIEP